MPDLRVFAGFFIAIVGVSAIAYTSATPAAPLQSPAQWTQFRLQNDNNAVLPGTLEASWRLHMAGAFSSSPTIANGVLYIGDNAGRLYALDPASGKILWKARVTNPLMSAPIVYGDVVIVGEGDENSPQGSSPSHPIRVGAPPSALRAYDRKTGALRWKVPLQGTGMPTPAIVDGILVHHNGAGSVIGLNPATGAVLYKHDIHSIASMVAALPLGNGRFATSGIDSNSVWALRAKDGGVVWESKFSPIASGIGDCPAASDGKRIYCDYVMPPTSSTPIQTERAAYFRAYALDIATGKKLWDVQLEGGILPKRNEAGIPMLANGTLYLGSSLAPYLHALDPQTGALRWKVQTHGPVKGGIAYASGTIYFGDLAGYLWAVDAASGKVIGDKKTGTPFNVGSPVIAGQTLIVGSRGGTLLALPLRTIRQTHDA